MRWKIAGCDGSSQTMADTFFVHSQKQVTALLQRLVARHLTEREIINACLRKGSADYSAELEPSIRNDKRLIISVGTNPNYVATICRADEKD